MMTTIQMVEQKGQCNDDEIHAKIARIRHGISELSQVYSLRLTLDFPARAREIPSHSKGHVTPPPLDKAEITVKTTQFL